MDRELRVFCGRSSPMFMARLGCELSELMGRPIDVPCVASLFNDGEKRVELPKNIRRADVFLVQSTYQPDGNLMELLVMCDAAKRASAGEITAVIPYFGYARQDKKVRPRVPITAKLLCDLLEVAGANCLLTCDLHAAQIQGFSDGPFDNLGTAPALLRSVRRELDIDLKEVAFVSPDDGGVERARETAKLIGCAKQVTFVLKSRPGPGKAEVFGVGDPSVVAGRTCLLVDDIADTFGTLEKAAEALAEVGAKRIIALCVHPVLSTDATSGERAVDRLAQSAIERLFVTDTIPLSEPHPKITVVSAAPLFARAIRASYIGESVHGLFERSCEEILTD
ncbi:MAG: ribose-phosphate diphosphokinase [Candidatus Uhrbacteria bacterium]